MINSNKYKLIKTIQLSTHDLETSYIISKLLFLPQTQKSVMFQTIVGSISHTLRNQSYFRPSLVLSPTDIEISHISGHRWFYLSRTQKQYCLFIKAIMQKLYYGYLISCVSKKLFFIHFAPIYCFCNNKIVILITYVLILLKMFFQCYKVDDNFTQRLSSLNYNFAQRLFTLNYNFVQRLQTHASFSNFLFLSYTHIKNII